MPPPRHNPIQKKHTHNALRRGHSFAHAHHIDTYKPMKIRAFVKFLIIICVVVVVAQIVGMFVQLGYFIRHFFCLQEKPDLKRVYCLPTEVANNEPNTRNQSGCWAVVTGASSGQGREFALQLADRGFNIVLIGSKRSHGVASIIRSKNVECDVIVKDFGKAFEEHFFDDIRAHVARLDVAVLVNNVGHRTGWKPFHESPTETIRETIACGTMVQTRLTQLLLPQLIRRLDDDPQHTVRSAVIFVTAQCMHPNTGLAVAGLYSNVISVPYLATYEASNAYGFYNACSLIKEYKHIDRLDMLNITPGAVITENTAHTLQETPFSVSAKDFVNNVMRFLGGNVSNGTMCAHWGHAMSNALIGLVPWKKESMLHNVGDRIATDYMKRYQSQQHKYEYTETD